MIIKSGGICYLFDFDGTIAGREEFNGVWKSMREWYRTGIHINPGDFDVRWSILTGRPLVDKLSIKIFCGIYGLTPEIILTANSFRYPWKNNEEKYAWKVQMIRDILNHKITKLNKLRPIMTSKVIYVDNDFETIDYINSKRDQFIGITVPDFIKGCTDILI